MSILDRSRCLQRVGWLIAGRRLVGLRTGGGQQRVGTCSRPADDGIRRFISLGDLIVKRTIGSVAFETQAFVGLFALRTRKQEDPSSDTAGDSFTRGDLFESSLSWLLLQAFRLRQCTANRFICVHVSGARCIRLTLRRCAGVPSNDRNDPKSFSVDLAIINLWQ